MAKKKETIINAVYILILLSGFYIFFKYIFIVILPFLLGFFVANILKGCIDKISLKIKIDRKIASFVILNVFYMLFCLIVFSFCVFFTVQLKRFIQNFPSQFESYIRPTLNQWICSAEVFMEDNNIFLELDTVTKNISESLLDFLMGVAKNLASFSTKIPMVAATGVVAIISSFFFSRDYYSIKKYLETISSKKQFKTLYTLKKQTEKSIKKYLTAQLKLMRITFFGVLIGLFLGGIKNFLLISCLTALADIIPLIGTGMIIIPWILYESLMGNTETAIWLLTVYTVVTFIRNILEPKIMGKELEIHPLISLITMFIGGSLFGLVGILATPIIVIIAKEVLSDKKVK